MTTYLTYRLTVRVFRSWAFIKFCVCPSFPFGFEGGMWDVILFIPDHCLSVYSGSCSSKLENAEIEQGP